MQKKLIAVVIALAFPIGAIAAGSAELSAGTATDSNMGAKSADRDVAPSAGVSGSVNAQRNAQEQNAPEQRSAPAAKDKTKARIGAGAQSEKDVNAGKQDKNSDN